MVGAAALAEALVQAPLATPAKLAQPDRWRLAGMVVMVDLALPALPAQEEPQAPEALA